MIKYVGRGFIGIGGLTLAIALLSAYLKGPNIGLDPWTVWPFLIGAGILIVGLIIEAMTPVLVPNSQDEDESGMDSGN
jgi:hypothetical protein